MFYIVVLFFISGKPSLVRETSKFSLLDAVRHPILTLKELKTKKSSALKDVILPPSLESRLGYVKIAYVGTQYAHISVIRIWLLNVIDYISQLTKYNISQCINQKKYLF